MIKLDKLLSINIIEKLGQYETSEHLSFYTDTRHYSNETVFIAIEGQNFKPLSFIENIQAPIIVCEDNKFNRDAIKKHKKKLYLLVKSSVSSLKEIASLIAREFKDNGGNLIAISGSNGKTTTKEMLFHILKNLEPETVCTQKNNNNHIGVPITMFQISKDIKNCIVELGSNHPGEIKYLVDMIEPNVGVCTNIGDTHLEFFETRENVFKEEGYLIQSLMGDPLKKSFLNIDDDFLSTLPNQENNKTYGKDPDADFIFVVFGKYFSITLENKKLEVENKNITGEHNKINMLVSCMISSALGYDLKNIKDQADSFEPTSNRSQWLDFKNTKIFLDAYNANPSSMKAAIDGFKSKCLELNIEKKKCALVLGDMNELGDNAIKYHEEIGKYCAQSGFMNLYFVGRYAHSYNKGSNYIGTEFLNSEQLKNKMSGLLSLHKALFIKGSRSLQLESTMDITLG